MKHIVDYGIQILEERATVFEDAAILLRAPVKSVRYSNEQKESFRLTANMLENDANELRIAARVLREHKANTLPHIVPTQSE